MMQKMLSKTSSAAATTFFQFPPSSSSSKESFELIGGCEERKEFPEEEFWKIADRRRTTQK
jgi:hypothetical protein